MAEIDRAQLETALQEGFAPLISRHEVDLVPDADSTAIELQADAWTLHCDGWPLRVAWLALDAEPESAERQREALLSTFGHGELAAFRSADTLTNHTLAEALRASGDSLSLTLAELIGEST